MRAFEQGGLEGAPRGRGVMDTIEQFFEVATDGAATAAFIAAVQRVAAEA